MMNTMTKKWGVRGAAFVVLLYLLLVIVQQSLPYGSGLRDSIHHLVFWIAAPVLWVWERLGVRGETVFAYFIPAFVPGIISIFVYLAAVGFAVGVLLQRLFASRC